MNLFKRIRCEIIWRKAVSMADRESDRNGTDYFVMPITDGKLYVITQNEYRMFRRKHLAPQRIKPRDLFRECIYHTHWMSAKDKAIRKRKYLRWKGVA